MAICPPHPSGMDEKSLGTLYPILNDYLGVELNVLTQNESVAVTPVTSSIKSTNGVRKVRNKYI